MKRRTSDKPSKFEVAIKKGEGTPSSELERPMTFLDKLMAFITFYERLGCPKQEILYKLGKIKAHNGSLKETAAEMDYDISALYKLVERLEAIHDKKLHPPLPKEKPNPNK